MPQDDITPDYAEFNRQHYRKVSVRIINKIFLKQSELWNAEEAFAVQFCYNIKNWVEEGGKVSPKQVSLLEKFQIKFLTETA